MTRSLVKDTSLLFAARMAAFVFAAAVPLVLVRSFSTEEFGLYRAVFLIHATCLAVIGLGLPASLFYFVPRSEADRAAYISQTLFGLGVLGVLGALVLLGLRPVLAQAFAGDHGLDALFPYLAVLVAVSLVASILENVMIITGEVQLASLTSLLSELFRTALMIAAALLTGSLPVLLLCVNLWAAARLVAVFAFLAQRRFLLLERPRADRVRAQVSYTMPFALALIVRSVTETLPQYAVAFLHGTAGFAIYSVAFLQVPLVMVAFDSVADVTLVRITELRASQKLGEAAAVIRQTVSVLWLAFVPLYFWMLVNSREILRLLYTERFLEGVPMFRVFLLMIPLTAVALDYVPRAFGDTAFILRVNVLKLVATLGLLAILLPSFGPMGAAVATVGAIAVSRVAILLKVRALLAIPLSELLDWKKLANVGLVAIVAAAASRVIGPWVTPHATLQIAVSALVFALAYAWMFARSGVLDPDDRKRFTSGALRALRVVTG